METPTNTVSNAAALGMDARIRGFAFIWLVLLLLAAYHTVLRNIAATWFDEYYNMEHGMLVPLAAGYMVWLKWDALRRVPVSPTAWGLVLVAWGVIQSILGFFTDWNWGTGTAFLVSLVGCIVTLYGTRMLRSLAYPLCTLLLMIPLPNYLWRNITLQLQLLASRLGEISLEALGYSVLREGNILDMVGQKLAVAEACSGIKSLQALLFLVVVYGYFFVAQKRVRAILLVAVVPIAVLCNAARIIATAVVGHYNTELAHGMLHSTFGYFSMATGAALCYLLHRLIVKCWPPKDTQYV